MRSDASSIFRNILVRDKPATVRVHSKVSPGSVPSKLHFRQPRFLRIICAVRQDPLILNVIPYDPELGSVVYTLASALRAFTLNASKPSRLPPKEIRPKRELEK